MKRAFALAVGSLLAILLRVPIFAQSPPGDPRLCGELEQAIEQGLKLVAMEDAERMADNSAPRATLSATKVQNYLLVASINLQVMRDNGCPARREPLSMGRYMKPALECQTDLLKMRLGKEVNKAQGSELPLTCDTSVWKPPSPI